MTELLEQAFSEAAKLPDDEQDALAKWMLQIIESEREWDAAFATSADALAKLAHEALAEFHAGETEELDPDAL
ncbi:MAG: hypothetical protein D6737_17770 [Chloroflexi bacterium]|nr:MAG: hypothetical protein D6737_17770 [Chloroflexota bacterium]